MHHDVSDDVHSMRLAHVHCLFVRPQRMCVMWACCDDTSSDDDEHNTCNTLSLFFADDRIAPVLLRASPTWTSSWLHRGADLRWTISTWLSKRFDRYPWFSVKTETSSVAARAQDSAAHRNHPLRRKRAALPKHP